MLLKILAFILPFNPCALGWFGGEKSDIQVWSNPGLSFEFQKWKRRLENELDVAKIMFSNTHNMCEQHGWVL